MATPATIKSGAYQTRLSQSFADKNSEVKIYDYSPPNWVKNIESGAPQNVADVEILKDLEIFQQQIGSDFSKVTVVGLFCTHYPLYKDKIENFFRKNGNKNAIFLTQGAIFSDKIYEDISTNLKKLEYKTRKKSVPTKCLNEVKVDSEVTGSIEQTKEVISKIHPKYLDKINFKQTFIK